MQELRLTCDLFYVDCRAVERDGRWIAVCDDAGDHSLGLGLTRDDALRDALVPFGPLTDELLSSVDAK